LVAVLTRHRRARHLRDLGDTHALAGVAEGSRDDAIVEVNVTAAFFTFAHDEAVGQFLCDIETAGVTVRCQKDAVGIGLQLDRLRERAMKMNEGDAVVESRGTDVLKRLRREATCWPPRIFAYWMSEPA
jgi:hypothetical protein